MTIRWKSTVINRVSVALVAAATIGSVIAGSAVPAAARSSKSSISGMTRDLTHNQQRGVDKANDQSDAYTRGVS